ncbi:hypothetical protein, partial [Bacteroides faecis]|uniref:hypothetical protein n=1 Tax=Bacteroides faecis TaxID=674529 RepID=UPI003DA59F5B
MTNFIYVANIQVFRQDDGILQIVIPQLPKKVEEVVSKCWHNFFLCAKPRLSQARALLLPNFFVTLGITFSLWQ